jgi:hypothetical protein
MTALVGTTLFVPYTSPQNGVVGKVVYTYSTPTGAAPPLAGDTITFSGDPLGAIPQYSILLTSLLIAPHPASSAGVDVGYTSTTGDVTTPNATNTTYFNSNVSIAAGGRYGPDATNTNVPVALPGAVWPILTFHGGNGSAGTYTLEFELMYTGSP